MTDFHRHSIVFPTMMPFTTAKTQSGTNPPDQPGAVAKGLSNLFDRLGKTTNQPGSDASKTEMPQPKELEVEILRLKSEQAVMAVENQLLNEMLCRDANAAANRLLRRLIPESADGFAGLYGIEETSVFPFATRGLPKLSDPVQSIVADSLNRLFHESVIIREIPSNPTTVPLSPPQSRWDLAEQSRPVVGTAEPGHEVFLIPIHRDEHLRGVLVTTALWPAVLNQSDQVNTLQRLAAPVVERLSDERRRKEQADELRLTREMLALKSITDRATEQPLEALGEFAARVCTAAQMDRAALYLAARRSGETLEPVLNAGIRLPATLIAEWSDHETRTARAHLSSGESFYDQPRLQGAGIKTLWGGAAVLPLAVGDRRLGTLVLSRQHPDRVTPQNERLIRWSADVLARTLHRIYCDAAIRRQARHDGLTDLANRRTFDAVLTGEVDRVRLGLSEECSLLLADLDRFKSINDQYGHQAGDDVLRLTAQLLREQVGQLRVGERSLLARYGGEELAILLPGVGTPGAMRIAEQIRGAVEQMTYQSGKHQLAVTVSIGVASCPRHGLTAADVLAATDAALYVAKSAGRNRVCQPLS